jgi:hypothetical protein
MTVLAVEDRQYQQFLQRQREQVLLRLLGHELRHLLNRWGQFLCNTADRTGLPTASAFTRIPGGISGHRILCADMPRAVYCLNQAVLRLDPVLQFYLYAWYALQRDEYGRWIEQADKAKAMGISTGYFRSVIHQARSKLVNMHQIWAT